MCRSGAVRMRREPQRRFCRASCPVSAGTSSETGGRPGVFGQVHILIARRRASPAVCPVSRSGAAEGAPGQQPGQRGEQGTVSPVRPGPGNLTPQHRDLMPQHKDLRVL